MDVNSSDLTNSSFFLFVITEAYRLLSCYVLFHPINLMQILNKIKIVSEFIFLI